MRPLLFTLGPIPFYGYGAMVVVGGFWSFWFLRRRTARAGLVAGDDFWILVNVVLLGGFIGGRILYVFEYTRPFSPLFWTTLLSLRRGFSVLGAFAGVPFGVWLFCRWRKVEFLRLLDIICVMAPLWHAFGRLGCFLAGCCYGRPTERPWGIAFRDPSSQVPAVWLGVPLHPTQLYECLGNAAIAAVLYQLLKKTETRRPGLVAAAYFAAYGVMRFFEEFYRGDAVPLGFLGLTAGQGLGAALAAVALVLLAWRSACTRSS